MNTNTSRSPIPIDLIDRYLAGEATPSEQAEIQGWLDETSVNDQLLARLKSVDGAPGPKPSADTTSSKEAAWDRIMAGSALANPRAKHWYQRPSLQVSSVVLAALVAFFAAPAVLKLVTDKNMATSTPDQYTVYSTRAGERTTVTLKDGSRVTLNVSTTLEVPRDFGGARRNVRLTGQAAFDVVSRNDKPFIIDALGTQTTVLGTVFTLRAYDPNVVLAVKSGKVAFTPCDESSVNGCQRDNDRVVLTTNEAATVDAYGKLSYARHVNVDQELAFTTGQLILNGKTLDDAIPSLERWYDIQIRLADPSLGNIAFEGTFPIGTVKNLIQVLDLVFNVRVERDGQKLILHPRDATSPSHSFGRDE